MKKVIADILRQYSVVPLALLLAMAPVLCCCFEGTASAAVEVSGHQAPDHSGHCGAKTDKSSENHDTKDCDCPHILAESSSLNITKIDSASNLFLRAFVVSPMEKAIHPHELYVALSTLDDNYFFHHPQNSPPIFVLNHTFRI